MLRRWLRRYLGIDELEFYSLRHHDAIVELVHDCVSEDVREEFERMSWPLDGSGENEPIRGGQSEGLRR